MLNNYIDVKVIVWKRLYFDDKAYMKGLAAIIEENGIDEVIDDKLGFIEPEMRFDTEHNLTPAENKDAATIEVYAGKKLVWDNKVK